MSSATEPEVDQSEGSVRFSDCEGGSSVGALLLGTCEDGVGLGMSGDTADGLVRVIDQGEGVVGDAFIGADAGSQNGEG